MQNCRRGVDHSGRDFFVGWKLKRVTGDDLLNFTKRERLFPLSGAMRTTGTMTIRKHLVVGWTMFGGQMRQVAIVSWSVFMFGFSGCTYYLPPVASSTTIGSKNEVPVQVVTGESTEWSFLFFGPFGDASAKAAIENAKTKSLEESDSIANVFLDRMMFCFPTCGLPIYVSATTQITGTLVRYKKDSGETLTRRPDSHNLAHPAVCPAGWYFADGKCSPDTIP